MRPLADKGRCAGFADVAFYVPDVGSLISIRDPEPSGGAQTQTMAVTKALAGLGLRVSVVAFGEAGTVPDQVDGVTVIRRDPYRERGPFLGKVIEPWSIWRALARTRAQTIVTRCAGIQLPVIGLFTKLTRRRFLYAVAASTEFSDAGLRDLLPRARDRWLFVIGRRLADLIVVQTEEQLAMCDPALARRAVLIRSVADRPPQQPRSAEAFVWIGRFASYKRPDRYVELARSLPEARFWMVAVPSADGKELEQATRAAANTLPNLELLEPRSLNEVGKLMESAVACVNTSDFEGMPNVLLEGWARGVPALAFAHDPGGVIERHGLGGFAGGSFERFQALAAALWRERTNDEVTSSRCREYVATHHSSDAIAKAWARVLVGDRP
ncbi:MAG TPA: glycosyltransferase family 4 protein [Chloroflexota bacterium]